MANEKTEIVFEFRIHAVQHDKGVSFEPAIFNQGIPMEHILSMMHSWLRIMESNYDENFKNILNYLFTPTHFIIS
jgi:hypothetical protein